MGDKGNPEKKKFVNTLPCTYIISVLSAWNSEFITYPFDLVKTRLQIQGEIANTQEAKLVGAPRRNFFNTTSGIIREEGITKIWSGLPAVMWRHVFYSGSRIVIYRFMRENIFKVEGTKLPLWISAVCGISAGVLAQFIANPADLLKTLIQMEGKRKLMGMEPRVHGLFDAFKKTLKTSGVTGLWKGSVPNMQRAAMVNLGDLSAYDVSKKFMLNNLEMSDSLPVHITASLIAGFAGAVLGTPSDTVKTRVMNQPIDTDGKPSLYKNTYDCFKKTVQNEGITALYKGFNPMWIRLGSWSLIFWVSYEQYSRLVGAKQF